MLCMICLCVCAWCAGIMRFHEVIAMWLSPLGYWFTSYAYIDVDTDRTTEAQCNAEATDGLRRVWAPKTYGATEECLVLPPAPDCEAVGWTRVNHLGNGREGVPLNYTWTLPYFPSGSEKLVVVRIRWEKWLKCKEYLATRVYSSSRNKCMTKHVYFMMRHNACSIHIIISLCCQPFSAHVQ